jgi:hypothetical protein
MAAVARYVIDSYVPPLIACSEASSLNRSQERCRDTFQGDFLEILAPGERLRHEFLAAPDILERLRQHCRVTHRLSDRGVAQVVLKPPGIGAPQLAQRESDLFIACSEAVSP